MNDRKLIAWLTLSTLTFNGFASTCLASETAKDSLISQMADTVRKVVSEDMGFEMNIYANIEQASRADSLPDKFDLRNRGVVPEIRNQDNFGTCWGFASIAACEISILSDLGLTTQGFLEKTGHEMDLSEKHLTWFSSVPIQATDDMTEQELIQVGEGRQLLNDDGSATAHYNLGGFMGFTSGQFASGIGPVWEENVPYTANNGSSSIVEDWSVDELERFGYAWELKESSFLPTPAGRDDENNYVYNEIATEMMKQELLAGRAVTIAYYSDSAMNPDAERNFYRDALVKLEVPEASIALYLDYISDLIKAEDLSEEDKKELKKVFCISDNKIPYPEMTDELLASMNEAQEEAETETEKDSEAIKQKMKKDARASAERIGVDFDMFLEWFEDFSKNSEAEGEQYINPDTFAHYVWKNDTGVNHCVTIVGYDDQYSASNFNEDHQPPADGAWIARNSWGPLYGDQGYFYLSYYDQSITLPETYEFVTDADTISTSGIYIDEYDFMPAYVVNSSAIQAPVYLANEFLIEADSVLSYVSTMTANFDTNVTTAVYLLNENSQSPIDGELLDVRTENYTYAGYHRIPLSQHYRLSEGDKISVVQTQRYQGEDGLYYALPYTLGLNCAYSEELNTLFMGTASFNMGIEGRIGRGESFIGIDGEWFDWIDFLEEVKLAYPQAKDYISFDNLSIKTYLYQLDDVFGEHNFGDPVTYAGGDVKLCTDCGYSLVEN